jgi:hypothetical protein
VAPAAANHLDQVMRSRLTDRNAAHVVVDEDAFPAGSAVRDLAVDLVAS